MWGRTLVYLGLREEPEELYDDLPERFVPEDDPHAEHAPPRPTVGARAGSAGSSRDDDTSSSPASAGEGGRSQPAGSPPEASNVRSLRTGDVHVRAVPATAMARAAVVEVGVFEDVEAIGARYRTGQPVLFDASSADAVTGRRVVDFVSGLTFALRGRLTKVGARAFLLVPDGIELSVDERRRLSDLGYRLPTGSDT